MNVAFTPLAASNTRNDEECSRIASPIGSGFRYACLPVRDTQRRALIALKALDQTLSGITDTLAEAQVARRKLDWWRNALYQLSTKHTAEHPILQALLAAVDEKTLNALIPHFESRLGAALVDIDYQGFETEVDLNTYLDAKGGSMYELYAEILAVPPAQRPPIRTLGALHQRLEQLTFLGRQLTRGRIYLPANHLLRANVTEADFHRPDAPRRLASLLQDEMETLEQQWGEATTELRQHTIKPAPFFRVLIALDRAQMKLLKRHDVRVLELRPECTPFTRLITAWWATKRPLPPLSPR